MSEPSSWQRNRVGPYTLLRRLRHVATSEEVGRLYMARHRPSGRRALVVAPSAPEHLAPASEYLLRVRTGTAPAPYVALEVERPPGGQQPVAELQQGVGTLWLALRGVEQNPEAMAHLARPARAGRRRGTRVQAWAGLAALAALALVCLPRAWSGGEVPPTAPAQAAPSGVAEEVLEEPRALPVGSMEGRAPYGLGLDMPPKPFRGQYRVDKQGKCKGRREVPINGGCWIALKGEAPCGEDAYEHKGVCYWPSMPAAREPSSTLPPRVPPVPAQRAQ